MTEEEDLVDSCAVAEFMDHLEGFTRRMPAEYHRAVSKQIVDRLYNFYYKDEPATDTLCSILDYLKEIFPESLNELLTVEIECQKILKDAVI